MLYWKGRLWTGDGELKAAGLRAKGFDRFFE